MVALREFDAVVEVMGLDEAFLGVATSDPEALARQVADRVRPGRSSTALSASNRAGDGVWPA
jgi:DNA polymerase-4